MKNIKKAAVLFLSIIIAAVSCPLAFSDTAEAALYNVYGDGMLFKQNSPSVFSGIATAGSTVDAVLYDGKNEVVTQGSAEAGVDGKFSVSFDAPAGSFEEYTVELKVNGKVFDTLENVVFGELWLASGQSNMQYPLAQAKSASENYKNGVKLSKWIRVLLVPPYPEYKGSDSLIPLEPQDDITDAQWINGENPAVYSMSAVGYFFAEELLGKLGMPVGILNSSLGGSSIRSWLSREAIDSDNEVKAYLCSRGEYVEKSDWKEDGQSVYYDMTANFNQKISPLLNFRISGMIWYQGETDLMLGNTQYDKQFSLMQKSYTEYFSYENGLLPVIYTEIAAYNYSDDGSVLPDWNIMYGEMQKEEPSSRAVVSIYDIPVTYLPEAGLIHPECKEEVADRMAFSAMGMVYGEYDTYTAPTVSSYEISGDSIYVKFDNTGDGLICPDSVIKGFSVSGADNIFVKAQAEIISADTVRIWADGVPSPTAFAYAYCVENGEANLYASMGEEKTLPVTAFISEKAENAHYWFMRSWADCDSDKVWYTEDDSDSGYFASWTGNKATVSFDEENGMRIEADSKRFSVSPVLTYKENLIDVSFASADTDYSDYGTLSFYVKNDGNADVTFKGLKMYENAVLWYSPAVVDTLDTETVIPADGKLYKITLDLNRVYHLGNECSLSYDNEKLGNIKNLEFCFTSSEKDSVIILDDITFTPTAENPGTRYDVILCNADSPMEFFTGLILFIFGKFSALFN